MVPTSCRIRGGALDSTPVDKLVSPPVDCSAQGAVNVPRRGDGELASGGGGGGEGPGGTGPGGDATIRCCTPTGVRRSSASRGGRLRLAVVQQFLPLSLSFSLRCDDVTKGDVTLGDVSSSSSGGGGDGDAWRNAPEPRFHRPGIDRRPAGLACLTACLPRRRYASRH